MENLRKASARWWKRNGEEDKDRAVLSASFPVRIRQEELKLAKDNGVEVRKKGRMEDKMKFSGTVKPIVKRLGLLG